jgi:hypothetical protein
MAGRPGCDNRGAEPSPSASPRRSADERRAAGAQGVSVRGAMETRFTPISIGASLGQAVDALLATAQHEFSAIDAFGKPDWRRAMTA